MVFDFTRRSGVVLAEVIAPGNAGKLAHDRATLWNAAEAAEKRKDGRTAREWIIALPAELDATQRADLARAFARELVRRYGVAADLAIHAPARDGDDRNHHAHILCTTRVVRDGALGDKAAIELSDAKRKTLGLGAAADEISALREQWAKLVNDALDLAGQNVRIDHRSLADQQIAALEAGNLVEALALARDPQRHAGVHATAMDRRSGRTESDRGRQRIATVLAAHRAAELAPRLAQVEMRKQRVAAMRLVRAESGTVPVVESPNRADIGTTSAVCAESGAANAPAPIHRAEIGADRTESGTPTERTESGTPREIPMHSEFSHPLRSVAELRAEIARRSLTVEQRLAGALPEKGRLNYLITQVKLRRSWESDWRKAKSAADSNLADWDHKHFVRATLARLRLRRSIEREQLVGDITHWQLKIDEIVREREHLAAEGRKLRDALPALEAQVRPRFEAAFAADQARLLALREELAAAEQREELERQAASRPALHAGPADPRVAPMALDAARVAAFVDRRVGSKHGPEYVFQHAYDNAAGISRGVGAGHGKTQREIDWRAVAIDGATRALNARNTPREVKEALGRCWPGPETEIDELLQQAQAQRLVDQIRSALDAGAEPVTDAGRQLRASMEGAADDAAARAVIARDFDAAVAVLSTDPGLRVDDQDGDRPAPRFM